MLLLRTASRSLRRNILRSLCTILAIAVMAGFLLLYCQNLDQITQKLKDTIAGIEVFAEVQALTGADDPYFPDSLLQEMGKTGFIKDEDLKARVAFSYGSAVPDGSEQLVSMTSPDLDRYFGKHLDSVIWAKNWTLEAWLSSNQPAMVLPQSAGFVPGDMAEMSLLPDDQEQSGGVLHASFVVAGIFNDYLDEEDTILHLDSISYAFCPFSWLYAQYGQGPWVKNELQYRYARLLLQNTENINAFKESMMALGFNTEKIDLRLIINDRLLIGAVNPLKKSVSLQRRFLPLLFALVVLLGALLCYLTMHSRRRELAIMRSMGMSSTGSFSAFLLETLLLCIFGTALGSLAQLRGGTGQISAVKILALFSMFYLIGGSISIYLLDRPNVLALLKDGN